MKKDEGKKGNASKVALLVGGAGLLLFILGVKRRYRLDDQREIEAPPRRRRGEEEEYDDEESTA